MRELSKICNICLFRKPVIDFYKNAGMADGYQNRCISCTKTKSMERYNMLMSDPVLKELEKSRHRDKYHRLAYKDIHKPTPEMKKATMLRYNLNYPEKRLAKQRTQHLLKQPGNELHHWSYNEEHYKDVIELSIEKHNFIHRFIVYDQEFYMYRDKKNNLLDTREKHEAYINSL